MVGYGFGQFLAFKKYLPNWRQVSFGMHVQLMVCKLRNPVVVHDMDDALLMLRKILSVSVKNAVKIKRLRMFITS